MAKERSRPDNRGPQQLQILVVDDDSIIRLMHRKSLESSNCPYPVITCANGKEALAQLEVCNTGECPFLVLLDLNMPVMNGWEFLQACQKSFPEKQLRVVVISSSVKKSDKKKAAGFSHVIGFCEKPFQKETFQEITSLEELQPYFEGPAQNAD